MPAVEKQWITTIEQPISIQVGGVPLRGELVVPEESLGLVLFAHGSEMRRSNPGSRRTVRELVDQGIAVLSFDLLSVDEESEEIHTGRPVVDVARMASRYLEVALWANVQPELQSLPIGFFGVGTAAASALVAAAERPSWLGAVACLNGRTELAGDALARVQAPTLLIVGSADAGLVSKNEAALLRLGSVRKELMVVPVGSTRIDAPAELQSVAGLTAEWLGQSLILVA